MYSLSFNKPLGVHNAFIFTGLKSNTQGCSPRVAQGGRNPLLNLYELFWDSNLPMNFTFSGFFL